MLFLSIYTSATPVSGPPSAEHMAEMAALTEKMMASGNLLMSGGLGMAANGFKIALKDGKYASTDGPFADLLSKGSGFGIMKANSKEELVPLMQEFLKVAGDGECVVMPMFGPEE